MGLVLSQMSSGPSHSETNMSKVLLHSSPNCTHGIKQQGVGHVASFCILTQIQTLNFIQCSAALWVSYIVLYIQCSAISSAPADNSQKHSVSQLQNIASPAAHN
jgi:hypothetical protein